MDDLTATCALLDRQLDDAVREDPIAALPVIVELQRTTEEHLRDAVRLATVSSSWREIAEAIGVSKQAAHQRFKAYAHGVAADLKTEHRAMKQAKRKGDPAAAAAAKARRDQLADDLRAAAKDLRGR
jgi:protein-disulfide isomerase-like protein with CxxC motif